MNGKLSFRAPGDDWYSGSAVAGYVIKERFDGKRRRSEVSAKAGAGKRETLAVEVPSGTRLYELRVWAVDEAGNRGAAAGLGFRAEK